MVIWTSLQACGVVLPFAISTSICRSSVTICSGLYLLIDMTGLPPQVNSLSFHLVQKSPVRSTSLNRYIAAKKIPLPPLVRIGGVRVRLWNSKDIAKVRALLPKLKNGRKLRYKKAKKKK